MKTPTYKDFLKRLRKVGTVKVFCPKARGTRRNLVPPLGKYPCDLCASAQYNKLCSESLSCAPFLYYQFSILERLPS